MRISGLKARIIADFKVSRLVRYFVLSDFVLLGGWGLMAPIFSIYVIEKVAGATLLTVGVMASIYWLVKSVIQLPIADYLDHTDGEKDDFLVLVGGLILAGVAAFLFVLADTVPKLYAVQFLHAIAFGMYVPSWSAIFSRHLDKNRYATSWSLNSTAIGIASGITGFLGAAMAARFGFTSVFLAASALSFLSAIIVFFVPDLILPAPKDGRAMIKDHSPLSSSGA
ncbi:MAG: MFS transporter [bacterium]|nr:MFS transporter [bacterium]